MKLIFLSNYINHHQAPLSDEFYKILGDNYHFIETEKISEMRKQLGYPDFSSRKYVLNAIADASSETKARQLIDEADVVIIGSAPENWVQKRLKENKVTFHYSERWFKKNYKSLLSPFSWRYWYLKHIRYRNHRSYMLCASAFTASDVHKVFAYPKKCFKWGYFTKVSDIDIDQILKEQRAAKKLKMMFVARFLSWKHPELPVQLAKSLKDKGVDFEINMYGTGEELNRIQNLIKELGVDDCVNLCGSKPNEEILLLMRQHHVFLFTSDRNEGWGAVANEAMSNGCMVVASNKIGSIPYLIKNKVNGLMFQDQSVEDLYNNVQFIIVNPDKREDMVREAYRTMHDVWSPKNAATSFINLATGAINNRIESPLEGPCSLDC